MGVRAGARAAPLRSRTGRPRGSMKSFVPMFSSSTCLSRPKQTNKQKLSFFTRDFYSKKTLLGLIFVCLQNFSKKC